MKLRILAVGTKMPSWVEAGVAEYTKRMPRDCAIEFCEIAPGNRGKNADVARAIAQEGDRMLAKMHEGEHVVALEVNGRAYDTPALSQALGDWRMLGCDIALLVGGPDGLDPRCSQRAQQRWSLSKLTLPHPLVRIVLAEQLYRAWTLLVGHPYHR